MSFWQMNFSLVLLVVLCCAPIGSHAKGAEAKPGRLTSNTVSTSAQEEFEKVKQRFLARRNANLLNAAGWTLAHMADTNQTAKIRPILECCGAFTEEGTVAQLEAYGGLSNCTRQVAALLENPDSVVRGFGAVLLAVIGGTNYTKDIAILLDKEPRRKRNEFAPNFDCSRAAMALGLLGATEYSVKLTSFLRSTDAQERTGAALGLGYMGAKGAIGEIAVLLDDPDEQVAVAACQTLGQLSAKEKAPKVARLLEELGDRCETACYTLARLHAKEQESAIAKLLAERFRKGYAAKSLALLGAQQYAPQIAALLQDQEPLVRCDGLIALGILGATNYSTEVSLKLADPISFVQPYAAVGLLLMGDQAEAPKILDRLHPAVGKENASIEPLIRLHPVVGDEADEIVSRAAVQLRKLPERKS
jgi:HEAT repeat protein